ncbi:hypothetical protein BJ138DRAFT_1181525 [Hygrophoropsis aurantiaca]|uniref:Uncharacterized protein n=1 Tax=Hygrophoropsis aurantiaca TaxID=72124 RepID=A0ACB8A6U4_9AGAM|nr:hypothetical protein BJ138DRAFT_1181525 [Hygrophoropsis aurantiaca]
MYRQLVAFAAVSFAGLQRAFAQPPNSAGVCLASTGYSWAVNSLNQDPCQVANDLFAADPCNQTDVSYPPLTVITGSGSYYTGPQANQSTSCTCNTVIYSLASACGLCQNGTFLYWSEWTDNCYATDTVYQEWPASIPSDTTIPPWAYMPLVSGFWSNVQAQSNATATQSTTLTITTTSTALAFSGSSVSTTSASAGTTGSGTGGAGNMSTSVGAGPIAGGIVGGVAAVAILGFLAIYFWRRRSQRAANPLVPRVSAHFAEHGEKPYSVPDSQPNFTKLYDPNDSSTFPRAPAPLFQNTESSNGISEAIAGCGRYTGAPEV